MRIYGLVAVSRCGMLPSMKSGFQCASCGEWNETSVDESAGRRQSYVEDCQVCCKPNVLRVEYDVSSQEFFIVAELE
jgi:cysteine-rich CPXCG protein